MVSLYILAMIATQGSALPPVSRPATKTCPDKSIILATEHCALLPDHRYMLTHQSEVQIRTTEWWCRGDKRPSMARFRIRLHQMRNAAGQSTGAYSTVELVALKVKGKQASASTTGLVRQRMAPLNSIGYLSGRCLHKRDGGVQSVLTMNGYERGRREPHPIEFELF